jgi:hypothetical protein
MEWMARVLISGRCTGIFLFTMSGTGLGSTQPPIQWMSGVLSQEVKADER